MNIYEVHSQTALEVSIPKMTMLSQAQCYIPIIEYYDLLNSSVAYYLYANPEPTLESFERDLVKCFSEKLIHKSKQRGIKIIDWSTLIVDNRLAYQQEGMKTKNIVGLLSPSNKTLVIGNKEEVNELLPTEDSILLECVASPEFTELEKVNSTLVLYNSPYGIEFRPVWNIETLSTVPTLYILGVNLILTNDIKLEFIAPVFKSTSMNALKSAILKMYSIDESCIAQMTVFPINVAHVSDEVEDVYNVNRIDKYNVIYDMTMNTAHIRTIKDVSPYFSQAKGLRNPNSNNRLMPVYSF